MHILDTITCHLRQKIKRNTKCSPYIYIYIYIFFFFFSNQVLGVVWIFFCHHPSVLTPFSSFITYYSSLKIPKFPQTHLFGTHHSVLLLLYVSKKKKKKKKIQKSNIAAEQ